MAYTAKTDVLGVVEEWLSREKAENISSLVVTDRFAQKLNMPKNKGDTIRLLRTLKYAKATTALGVTSQPASPTETHKTTYIEKTLAAYGDNIKLPHPEIDETAIINMVKDVKNEQNDQIADTLDWLNLESLVGGFTSGSVAIDNGIYPYRVDGDTDYQVSATCTSTGTTTTAISTTLTQADDYWNGGIIIFTGQTAILGNTRPILDFVASTDTVSWTNALLAATTTSDTFWICVGTGITGTDKMTISKLLKIKRQLIVNKCRPWSSSQKGKNLATIHVMIVDPYVEYDLWDDADFKERAYRGGMGDFMESGAFAEVVGMHFVRTTEGYQESVAGVQGDTGVVHVSPVFGKNCYATTRLNGHGKSPDGIVMEIKPDPNPNTRYYTLAWTVYRAAFVKMGLAGIRVMSGASS